MLHRVCLLSAGLLEAFWKAKGCVCLLETEISRAWACFWICLTCCCIAGPKTSGLVMYASILLPAQLVNTGSLSLSCREVIWHVMQFLDGWTSKLWSRFFCLSVYVTMYLNDHQRSAFYESLGLQTTQFNR